MQVERTIALNKLQKLNNRTKIIRGGTSAGKTICIILILIDYAIKNEGKEISIVAQSIPALKRGAFKDFCQILKGIGRYKDHQLNRSALKYTFSNGSYIEFFSTDIPEKIRGARRTDLFINECNNVSFESFNQLAVWLDYNPSVLFWADKELIGQPNTDFITLTYKDNEVLSESIVKEIEKAKEKGKTSTYWANWWKVYGLGELGSLEGVCIPDWKEINTVPESARLLCGGFDFGYSVDQSSYIRLYKYNNSYIFDELLYKKGMLNSDISNFLKSQDIKETLYADSAEPKSIAELRSYGHQVYPVTKGRDSIVYGINLINQNVIYVTKRSKNLIRELQGYIWSTDKAGNVLQKPQGADHAIDAARYSLMMQLDNPNKGEYHIY